jgi:hypothetical protein
MNTFILPSKVSREFSLKIFPLKQMEQSISTVDRFFLLLLLLFFPQNYCFFKRGKCIFSLFRIHC